MATPLTTPRINNNDDEVKLVSIDVTPGQFVRQGQTVAQIETDKAVMEVAAPIDGYVLAILAGPDSQIMVGSTLMWLGTQADEAVPQQADEASQSKADAAGAAAALRPTAKARLLLRQHGLQADEVPIQGKRLEVADIEAYLSSRRRLPFEDLPGRRVDLTGVERGMAATVSWQREHAATGYIEIEYDPAPWDEAAKAVAGAQRLLLSPLLPLMMHRLARLAAATPALNATWSAGQRYEYEQVNLGSTVQVGDALYLVVLRNADAMASATFVAALGDLQRRAMQNKLQPEELQGATVGFSSMSRWKVSRHVPILAPWTSLMVAHAVSRDGRHVLGASYDHRVLTGLQVVSLLRSLAKPE
jgi:pyruvate/2-oxoglutarate dehydrogenase complex dihydrolipoamide acyltransferase (E2) component